MGWREAIATVWSACGTAPTSTWADGVSAPATSDWDEEGAVAGGFAAALAMTTQPAGAVGGVALTTQPVVQLVDANGSPTSESGVVVTAALSSGSLSGSVTAVTVNGVATFAGLVVDDVPLVAASSRTLTFSAPGLTSVVSAAFTVVLGGDMAVWYETDDASNVFAGSNLTTLVDRTGHGRSMTVQAGTILKALAQINALPALDFSTSGSNYGSDVVIPVKGSLTYFAVLKVVSGLVYQNMLERNPDFGNGQTWLFWDQPANKWQADGILAGAAVAGAWVTLVIHFTNSGSNMQVKVRANGAEIFSGAASPTGIPVVGTPSVPVNVTFTQFHRSYPSAGNFPYKSLIASWGIYAASQDGSEAALESYLRAKYATW